MKLKHNDPFPSTCLNTGSTETIRNHTSGLTASVLQNEPEVASSLAVFSSYAIGQNILVFFITITLRPKLGCLLRKLIIAGHVTCCRYCALKSLILQISHSGPFTVILQSLSRVRLLLTPWTAASQPPCPSPIPRVHSDSCLSSR